MSTITMNDSKNGFTHEAATTTLMSPTKIATSLDEEDSDIHPSQRLSTTMSKIRPIVPISSSQRAVSVVDLSKEKDLSRKMSEEAPLLEPVTTMSTRTLATERTSISSAASWLNTETLDSLLESERQDESYEGQDESKLTAEMPDKKPTANPLPDDQQAATPGAVSCIGGSPRFARKMRASTYESTADTSVASVPPPATAPGAVPCVGGPRIRKSVRESPRISRMSHYDTNESTLDNSEAATAGIPPPPPPSTPGAISCMGSLRTRKSLRGSPRVARPSHASIIESASGTNEAGVTQSPGVPPATTPGAMPCSGTAHASGKSLDGSNIQRRTSRQLRRINTLEVPSPSTIESGAGSADVLEQPATTPGAVSHVGMSLASRKSFENPNFHRRNSRQPRRASSWVSGSNPNLNATWVSGRSNPNLNATWVSGRSSTMQGSSPSTVASGTGSAEVASPSYDASLKETYEAKEDFKMLSKEELDIDGEATKESTTTEADCDAAVKGASSTDDEIKENARSSGDVQPGVSHVSHNLLDDDKECEEDIRKGLAFSGHASKSDLFENQACPIEAILVEEAENRKLQEALQEIERRERELAERESLLEKKMASTSSTPAPIQGDVANAIIVQAVPVSSVLQDNGETSEFDDFVASTDSDAGHKKKEGFLRRFKSRRRSNDNLVRDSQELRPTRSIARRRASLYGSSTVAPTTVVTAPAKFMSHEIKITSKVLSSDGMFATVLVDNILLDGINGGGGGADNDLKRQDISGQVAVYRQNKESVYCVKFVQPSVLRQGGPMQNHSITALKAEISILSQLQHGNIVKARGQSTVFSQGNEQNVGQIDIKKVHPTPFFYLMESCVSNGTLRDRLNSKWIKKFSMTSLIGGKSRKARQRETFFERVQAVSELASAISYLHSKNIMHGDIVPENIGFGQILDNTSSCGNNDSNSTTGLKLFNFARSRVLKTRDGQLSTQAYDLTLVAYSPMVGTLPYAAPEIGITDRHCCGLGVDTYAFAIIAWEMLTLKTALDDFHQYLMENAQQHVAIAPKLNAANAELEPFHTILEQCWNTNPQFRTRMDTIHDIIQQTGREFQYRSSFVKKTSNAAPNCVPAI